MIMKEVYKGYILCFLGVFSWSFSEIMVVMLRGAVGPVSLSFLRFFIGGLFLLIIMVAQKDLKGMFEIIKRHKILIILSSMVALGISNIIYFLGLQFTFANVGSALYTTYPLFISVYSVFILNERTNLKLKLVGLIVGITGTTILITNFQLNLIIIPENLLGNILIVIAAMIWAFYSVLGKYIFRKSEDIKNVDVKYTIISNLLSCVPIFIILLLTPVIPIFESEINSFLLYTWDQWLIILILGIIATGLGLYIFFKGIKKIEVSKGISLALFKPVIATIFSFFILREVPTIALYISLPLIIGAVLLINKPIRIKSEKSKNK
ncbi:MAG: EamA family transporter [Candidatus Lokiarchaeota archaeon]|nr:EamA family transporter [Candidatus Lokiarchaeota archaeon]